jgi:hypothetical protein
MTAHTTVSRNAKMTKLLPALWQRGCVQNFEKFKIKIQNIGKISK